MDGWGRFELADALQRFAEDGFLLDELVGVGDVLVVASAADTEVGARRGDAERGGIGDAFGAGAEQLRFLAGDGNIDGFVGENEGGEDDVAAVSRQAVTSVDELLNGDGA